MGDPRPQPSGTELIGLGAALALCVVVPLVAGIMIDSRLNSSPAATMIGILLGIVAACLTVYVRFKRYW